MKLFTITDNNQEDAVPILSATNTYAEEKVAVVTCVLA